LLALVSIYLFGGEILKGFSLAMIMGVVFGTYSSIYIANPILVKLRVSQKNNPKRRNGIDLIKILSCYH
jgi:preprotein translocase subunit SecF